ncbi:MAG TPA: hypothetical protein VKU80_09355 [Planctomycetota bacterium]|nr:hypothetical protein [Planctomycetota bacterium]
MDKTRKNVFIKIVLRNGSPLGYLLPQIVPILRPARDFLYGRKGNTIRRYAGLRNCPHSVRIHARAPLKNSKIVATVGSTGIGCTEGHKAFTFTFNAVVEGKQTFVGTELRII